MHTRRLHVVLILAALVLAVAGLLSARVAASVTGGRPVPSVTPNPKPGPEPAAAPRKEGQPT